ncbi:tail protein [Pseudomonas phage Dolphis]|nr:tail protein [Pseudomonas phage Dolphis]
MPQIKDASPQVSVRLYKTISRKTIDGQSAVSARYEGKDEYIDLTPYLGDGSSVVTSKSVREPAGAWSVTFADRPQNSVGAAVQQLLCVPTQAIESIYGLVEPMDVIEIRMWGGVGPKPAKLPIKMRGFVSRVERSQSMTGDGKPVRQVVISGQDYGKIWQTFQVLYLAAYAEGQALLTSFNLWDMFGVEAKNVLQAGEFVRQMIQKVINPHITKFMPKNSPMPKELQTGDSIAVKHGVVNNSYQNMQGSIYDILKFYGDVGVWNELYTEDREDGVHVVYRPIPALHMTKPDGAKSSKIQDDAPEPIHVYVPDDIITNLAVQRSDDNVANFYWVNNSRFDLVDDLYRKLSALKESDGTVNLKEYPNSAVKYYGVRPMYAETQQAGDEVTNMGSGQDEKTQEERQGKVESWIEKRRRLMVEMNRDNVVLERGTARIKGGLTRDDGEAMKAGDYAMFRTGDIDWRGYVVSMTDEFLPYQGYTATLQFERGEGFVTRTGMEGGMFSPWLAEQARRQDVNFIPEGF